MMLVVELVDDELDIEPIHRLRRPSAAGVDLRERLADAFDVIDVGPYSAHEVDALLNRMADRARPRHRRSTGLAVAIARPDPRQHTLAGERPGRRPRPTPRSSSRSSAPRLPEATWRYWHDTGAVAALVDKGAASRGDPVQPGIGRADARGGNERRPDATEDDLLHTQAAHRGWSSDASDRKMRYQAAS